MTSAPARAWIERLAHQRFDRLVVEDADLACRTLADEAVVAVAGVRVERDVGDEAELRELPLDGAAGLADEIAVVEGLAAALVLEMRLGVRKERDRRDVERDRPPGLAHRLVDAEPVDARHRRDRNAPLLAVDEKERPDEVARRQHVLRDQPPRPFRLAVAARALREVETSGSCDAGRFVHGRAGSFAALIHQKGTGSASLWVPHQPLGKSGITFPYGLSGDHGDSSPKTVGTSSETVG